MQEEVIEPGHASLRRFRISNPGAKYFITSNIAGCNTGLDQSSVAAKIFEEWNRLEAEQIWFVLTGVVMPDHIHLLIQLGHRCSLSESMRLFRGRLSPVLRAQGLRWQKAFYEHRLRSPADMASVVLYIYLNPYRAGLLKRTDVWPGYFCRREEWAWFGGLTANAKPQPEWLR